MLKRLITAVFITALAATASLAPTVARAENGATTVGGDSDVATAFFLDDGDGGCLKPSVFVTAAQTSTMSNVDYLDGAGTGAFVFVRVWDACQQAWVMNARGRAEPANVHIREGLNHATLVDTVQTWDTIQQVSVPVHLDLTWTSSGMPLNQRFVEHLHVAGPDGGMELIVNRQAQDTHRPAIASGTIAIGSWNLEVETAIFTALVSFREGSVTIDR